MAAIVATRPFPQSQDTVSASAQIEVVQYFPFHQLSQKPAGVKSHYRPHSTLYLDSSPLVSHRNSVLVKSRRLSTIHRSSSVGANMGLGIKKNSEKDKNKTKEKARELPNLRINKFSDISVPAVSPPASPPDASTKALSPPRTPGGETMSERSSGGGKPALPRLRPQRSMVSLFSATSDVSLHMDEPIPPRLKSAPPPSSFRSVKMDVDKAPSTPTSTRSSKRSSRQANDFEMANASKRKESAADSFWLTRSKTKVHPFPGEAPYMVSYDTPSLDNDRYTELLLQRLNPGSPSFHDYGRKPPLTVLDLGCGQGHWVLWAASVWKASRITGFDLVDITLPAFQTTENVNFIRGNFLFKLPFPAKSFEYVRMSNLSLAVPYNMWPSLLAEVRRVLTSNGRMELIDDQICFPYGEEPKGKDEPTPTSERRGSSGAGTSFFNFGEDSDSEDETFEDVASTSTTSSTASTLVNDFDLSKLPSSKRSSTDSKYSTRSNPVVSVIETTPFVSNRDKPLPNPTEEPSSLTVDHPPPAISPSPTITQDNINSLNDSASLGTSTTITQDSQAKRHRKTNSGSSTKSIKEAIGAWKQKRDLSLDMEHIFEYLLINNAGIHPRPSEFIQDLLRQTFGKGNAGKIRSYHIKLAPYDSPIGPGGALAAPLLPPPEPAPRPPVVRPEHSQRPPAPLQAPSFWKGGKEKTKRPRTSSDAAQSTRKRKLSNPSTGVLSSSMISQPMVISPKAARQLGISVPPVPAKRLSAELSTSSESSSSGASVLSYRTSVSSSKAKDLPEVADKAAERLGLITIPPPPPPKPIALSRSSGATPGRRPSPQRGTTVPAISASAAHRLGLAISPPISRSTSTLDNSSLVSLNSEGSKSKSSLPPLPSISRESSSGGSSLEGSHSSESASDGGISPPVAVQSNSKAAFRLGVAQSVATAAAAEHSRKRGAMAPAQAPGLLVWPASYIAMSPTEVEMHSCKYLQTLLGCRHALHEYITHLEADGEKLATEQDFEDAIWEYECFRRSRFHWPLTDIASEIYNEQGPPEPPSPLTPAPPGDLIPSSKKTHSRDNSLESYNGQYRREQLIHVRTIRVFEAVKSDDKMFSNMKFNFSTPQLPRKSPSRVTT